MSQDPKQKQHKDLIPETTQNLTVREWHILTELYKMKQKCEEDGKRVDRKFFWYPVEDKLIDQEP